MGALSITFQIVNYDGSDARYLRQRKQAIAQALNELSFPERGRPVNQLGAHGASVAVTLDHSRRHARIDVRGAQCTGGCTIGTVASAQSIHDHFAAVVVPNNIIQTYLVSVGGRTLAELRSLYTPSGKAPSASERRFSIFGR